MTMMISVTMASKITDRNDNGNDIGNNDHYENDDDDSNNDDNDDGNDSDDGNDDDSNDGPDVRWRLQGLIHSKLHFLIDCVYNRFDQSGYFLLDIFLQFRW